MGSILSYILSSNIVAASLFVIIIAVIWSNQPSKKIPKRQNRQARALPDKKRPTKPVPAHEDASKQTEEGSSVKHAPPAEELIPGGLSTTDVEQSALSSSGSLKKEKKKKGRRSRTPIPSDNPAASVHSVAGSSRSPIVSADESNPKMNAEEAWTRVESRHRTSTSSQNVATSDAGLTTTTSVDDDASSVGGLEKSVSEVNRLKPQTLAEKLLPKGRKTEVDDILETPNYPTLSRVMRITSPPEQPATGFSWGDYEDAEDVRDRGMDADGEDDGGWDVVPTKSRGKAKHTRPSQPDKAVESKTKKQKQNQARREAEKVAKEEGEKQRLALLASHRREMEKAIIEEQSKKTKKKQPVVSGGMKATVDAQGHMVWED